MATGRRIRPLSNRVVLTLDGERLEAERGEPIAASLIAAGKRMLARSPKFHRPRGPTCMRAACDGCLARVDGAPNVMTCMTHAEDGREIVSQNRLGPRETDLLRMTDWFFPEGMNHHELFAGIPGVQTIMQGFARRVAGLGRLPSEAEAPHRASRRQVDVFVVGAGPAGMEVASRLAAAGRAVEVAEDQLLTGGGILALAAEDATAFEPIMRRFADQVARGKIRVRTSTTAGAIYGRDLLVASDEDGAEVIDARAIVLACGAHDGALAFEGNDVPGVMSARAGGLLLRHGVLVGDRVAVIVTSGGGPFGESYMRAAAGHAKVDLVYGEPVAVRGSSGVKAVRVRSASDGKERNLDVDAVLVDAPRSPAYELAQQAGASLVHHPRGFLVQATAGLVASDAGRTVWTVGEICGAPFDAAAIEREAATVAEGVLRA